MFGKDYAFLNRVVKLLQRLPAYPMFGRGLTRLQPVYVEDVAEAIARGLQPTAAKAVTYELGGPRIYTYEELVTAVAHWLGKRPVMFTVPFPIWHLLARIAEMLPMSPLSRNQVELMEIDTVASAEMPGFDTLGIVPQPIELSLGHIIERG
jgi:uncharacterized protein YbjT (DUF2867 family)